MDGMHKNKGESLVLNQRNEERVAQTVRTIPEGMYEHAYNPQFTQYTVLTDHMVKEKMNSVRLAIQEKMGAETYKVIDDIHRSPEAQARQKKLHHARGTRFAQDGSYVLEIDMAGSGFTEFRREHKGFHGKGKEGEEKLQEEYGKSVNSILKHVRVKDKVFGDIKKKRVTIAGTQTAGGSLNTGKYQIGNVEDWAFSAARAYLRSVFDKLGNKPPKRDIHILLRGHSRGGVASSEAALMIKNWVERNYSGYAPYVKFDLIQYDPVPGLFSDKGTRKEIELAEQREQDNRKKLGSSLESTVVYTINADHKKGFIPQLVRGAKRVILTAYKHSVGMDKENVDRSQIGAHREAYTDVSTGEVYRGSGLNDLPEGVYFLDEQKNLVRMNTYEQAMSIMKNVLKESDTHKPRQEVLGEVIRDWFDRRGFADTSYTMDDLLADRRKTFGITRSDSKHMQYVKASIEKVKNLMKENVPENRAEFDKKVMTAYSLMLRRCDEYIHTRKPDSDDGERRLAMVKAVREQTAMQLYLLLNMEQTGYDKYYKTYAQRTLGDMVKDLKENYINRSDEDRQYIRKQAGKFRFDKEKIDEKALKDNKVTGRKLVTILKHAPEQHQAQNLVDHVGGKLQYDSDNVWAQKITYVDEQADQRLMKSFIFLERSDNKDYRHIADDQVRDQPLFQHVPNIHDVKQGMLGDCFFLAALSSLAYKSPVKIMECMKDNGDGTVTVRFFKTYPKNADRRWVLKDMPESVKRILLERNINNMLAPQQDGAQNEIPSTVKLLMRLLTFQGSKKTVGMKRAGKLLAESENTMHLEKIHALAQKLAQDERFAPVIKAMTDTAEKYGQIIKKDKRQADKDSVTGVLEKGCEALEALDEETFDKLISENQSALDEIKKTGQVPVYVTVRKTVIKETDGKTDKFAKDTLWVQIMEKAYAASGINRMLEYDYQRNQYKDKELQRNYETILMRMRTDNDSKNLHMTPDQIKLRAREELEQSFMTIEGGNSHISMTAITGQQYENVKVNENTDIIALTKQDEQTEKTCWDGFMEDFQKKIRQIPDDKGKLFAELTEQLQGGMLEQLKKQFLKSFDKSIHDHRWIGTYTERDICIEDLQSVISAFPKWNKDLYKRMIAKLPSRYPELDAEDFDKYLAEYGERLAAYCDGLSSHKVLFQHTAFATVKNTGNGTQTGKYTASAMNTYSRIRDTLAANGAVCVGIKTHIPQILNSQGKNGEAVTGGIVERHAYSVVGLYEENGFKYVTLRNPWGEVSQYYEQITQPGKETVYKKKQLHKSEHIGDASLEDNGVFHMELNDFMGRIHSLYI